MEAASDSSGGAFAGRQLDVAQATTGRRGEPPNPLRFAPCVRSAPPPGYAYQLCSEKHLHRYLAEFDFRYNNRERLGVSDLARTGNALKGARGKRLKYRDSSTASA